LTQQYAFSGVLVLISILVLYLAHRDSEEEPRRYSVPPPKFPDGDKTVDETSIKARERPLTQT